MDSSTTLRSLIPAAATICLILVHSTPANSIDVGKPKNRTAYDVLEYYNLPHGILPKGVEGYDYNNVTGKFTAFLSIPNCTLARGLEYQVKYNDMVKAYLSEGRMTRVEGMSMRLVLVWMKVVNIVGRGNVIDFLMEGGNAGFPIEHFEDAPRCGCTINCMKSQTTKESHRKSLNFV